MTYFVSGCSNRCQNKSLCVEKLSLVLPEIPPYYPRQFGQCAVIGNSGDLLRTKFGKEIDSYDAVVRENGAPIQVIVMASNYSVASFCSICDASIVWFVAELYRPCGKKKHISTS